MSRLRIQPDAFGWFLIKRGSETLQAFRTERECRQWIADTARIRRALGKGCPMTTDERRARNAAFAAAFEDWAIARKKAAEARDNQQTRKGD